MARYTGSKCRLCRREGEKLFLKGARCHTDKCAITRRNQPPGDISRRRSRQSDYGKHLREKQKVKRIYGLLENQFRRYYDKAARTNDVTGPALLKMLETRLDTVVFISGLATSRAEARQIVRQKKVMVNDKIVDIPSYQVKEGDLVSRAGIENSPKEEDDMSAWLNWEKKDNGVKIVRLPTRDDIDDSINEQLIVEFYSR